MGAGFNIAQYLPGPEGLSGWDSLHRAVSAVAARRQQRELQAQAEAHAQQMQQARQTFEAEQDRVAAAREAEVRRQALERENAQAAATAAADAMRAEREGRPEEAEAIVTSAAPSGLTSTITGAAQLPNVPRSQLREPQMRATPKPAVAPQQGLAFRLPEPMASVPGTGSALWDAIQREQGRLSTGAQGRQVGGLAQEIGGMGRPPMPEIVPAGRILRRGDTVLGQTNREEDARMRQERARVLAAPGALARVPAAKGIAEAAQQQAVVGTDAESVQNSVAAAMAARRDALALLRAQEAQEARVSGQAGSQAYRSDARAEQRIDMTMQEKGITAKNQAAETLRVKLDAYIQNPDNGAAFGALQSAMAIMAQGGVASQLSDLDLRSASGAAYLSYMDQLEAWAGRGFEGEPPQAQAADMVNFAQYTLEAQKRVAQKEWNEMTQFFGAYRWSDPGLKSLAQANIAATFGPYIDKKALENWRPVPVDPHVIVRPTVQRSAQRTVQRMIRRTKPPTAERPAPDLRKPDAAHGRTVLSIIEEVESTP